MTGKSLSIALETAHPAKISAGTATIFKYYPPFAKFSVRIGNET